MITGRTNSYNENVSNSISTFDDDIGYIAGLPQNTTTLAHAFKDYGKDIGKPYKTYYNGKWGIGGTAWVNTPMVSASNVKSKLQGPIDGCSDIRSLFSMLPYCSALRAWASMNSKGGGELVLKSAMVSILF